MKNTKESCAFHGCSWTTCEIRRGMAFTHKYAALLPYPTVKFVQSLQALAGTEKTAGNSLYGFGGGHHNSVILIQSDVVGFTISADDIGVQDERQTVNGSFDFIFKFVAFVDAQPELVMRGSTTTDFDFTDSQEGFVVIVVFLEKSFDFFSGLRREIDRKHEFLQKLEVFCAIVSRMANTIVCRPFLLRQQQELHPFMRDNDKSPGLIQRYSIAFAIEAGHVGVQHEGDALKAFVKVVFLHAIEAQPELTVMISAAAHLGFINSKAGMLSFTFVCVKRFEFFSRFRRKHDFQHKSPLREVPGRSRGRRPPRRSIRYSGKAHVLYGWGSLSLPSLKDLRTRCTEYA